MTSLRLPGPPAYSSFRREKLLSSVQHVCPGITAVQAYYEHFVELEQDLSVADLQILSELLRYGPAYAEPDLHGHDLLVIPRIGTTSPWSSKATDIARNCGLTGISRIERGVRFTFARDDEREPLDNSVVSEIKHLVHDRMTETCCDGDVDMELMFARHAPAPLAFIAVSADGRSALVAANNELGLALSDDEIDYLHELYISEHRDPTDAELMMFSQANSEHCRHKVFNASWTIDGEDQPDSLFDMIRMTHAAAPEGVLSAYKDNSAVISGGPGERLLVADAAGNYDFVDEDIHILMKVETHNHPTAISPFPGAATGSGGEIRDEGATGRGATPKAGLTGFSVSHLRIPGFVQPWESSLGKPDRIASPQAIMLEGPIGGAAFNNEFGRPNIAGYFRTFEQLDPDNDARAFGYHKPIMIAGGLGNIRAADVQKPDVPAGALVVVLGGPAMLIGLGGGAASSVGSGASHADLDFASVQRGNPEMQRRAQQVIDACWSLGAREGEHNPIVIIHDVGAGGLSNAVPEVVDHSALGADIDLRAIQSLEAGMSPLEIWCNEAQERYVIALMPEDLPLFSALCERERCPYSVIGTMNNSSRLVVEDSESAARPVDMDMQALLGKTPQTLKNIKTSPRKIPDNRLTGLDLAESCRRILQFPTVADKSFLIHIADRTVGGLVSQDQLVGPWQVPVSDVAVTLRGFTSTAGEAMAMGERTPVALLNPAASGRLSVGEAVTNLAAARINKLSDVRLSANWMAASGLESEDQALFETVTAVGRDLCRDLGIAIPVGKDSLSMQTRWQDEDGEKSVQSPLSLIVSGFAPVSDVRRTLTPQLRATPESHLFLIDLGEGNDRLGGSCLSQVYELPGGAPADLVSAKKLQALFELIQSANEQGYILAYHDRSDGGLFATLVEMSFAGHIGIDVVLPTAKDNDSLHAALFSEELGAVVQVPADSASDFQALLVHFGLDAITACVGACNEEDQFRVIQKGATVFASPRVELHRLWSEVSYRMQAERDNPLTAMQQYDALLDVDDPGLSPRVEFDPQDDVAAPYLNLAVKPRVAVLREQGVNSHSEMAAALHRSGFAAVDVHMTDLLSGRFTLSDFAGAVACGGFSYGDVLGAGGGWAKSILFNSFLRDQFAAFFDRQDSFTLGVCNGCQMLADLQELIPGSGHWPNFVRNRSEQFEARLSLVEVMDSPSIMLSGMQGSLLPIAVSHGEGRAEFSVDADLDACFDQHSIVARYVNNYGEPAMHYPANPNGSPGGIAGLCSADGSVTILMPHPERVHLSVQHSWCPEDWGEEGPWLRLFRNARVWVD